jgi:hypothetical protein
MAAKGCDSVMVQLGKVTANIVSVPYGGISSEEGAEVKGRIRGMLKEETANIKDPNSRFAPERATIWEKSIWTNGKPAVERLSL